MNIQQSISTCLRRSFDLSGRASRSEYWWFALVISVISAVIKGYVEFNKDIGLIPALIIMVISFGLLIPATSVTVRRLHDLNYSGWILVAFALISFMPITALLLMSQFSMSHEIQSSVIIWMIVFTYGAYLASIYFLAKKGTSGPNQYGPDPLNNECTSH